MENDKSYTKPVLVTLGSAEEMTQNVNTNGPGDSVFSILDQFS